MKALNLQGQILLYKVPPSFILVSKLLIIIGPVQNQCEKAIRGRPYCLPGLQDQGGGADQE